jgi:hypothetical protein
MTTAAVFAFFAIPTLVALAIGSDSRRRDQAHAQAVHPSTYYKVDEVVIAPVLCGDCGQAFYHLPTDGHDLDVVAWASRAEWLYAFGWHRSMECAGERVA